MNQYRVPIHFEGDDVIYVEADSPEEAQDAAEHEARTRHDDASHVEAGLPKLIFASLKKAK